MTNKHVDQKLYYIVAETPQGNWGTDIEGLHLENLLPWQLDTSAADCVGQIHSVANVFGLITTARGIVDNYVVKVQCGRCAHIWHDGLRYQNETLVRCPNCEARNNVDSSGVTLSNQPERQATVITSSHTITDESWGDPGIEDDQEATLAGVDQAVTTCRDAVAATPPEHPHRPGRLLNLGHALYERFEHTGQSADLDDAITAFTQGVATTPHEDPEHPERLATRRDLPGCRRRSGHR